MQRPKGINNDSGYPMSRTSNQQAAVGGKIVTKTIPATATQLGHKQVNPGSNKK